MNTFPQLPYYLIIFATSVVAAVLVVFLACLATCGVACSSVLKSHHRFYIYQPFQTVMAATTSRKANLLTRSRRTEEDGEEDGGFEDLENDSQSEASVLTIDEQAATESDVIMTRRTESGHKDKSSTGTSEHGDDRNPKSSVGIVAMVANDGSSRRSTRSVFVHTTDVVAMTHGFELESSKAKANTLDFENSTGIIVEKTPVKSSTQQKMGSIRQGNTHNRASGDSQTELRQRNRIAVSTTQGSLGSQRSTKTINNPPSGQVEAPPVRGHPLNANGSRDSQSVFPPCLEAVANG